MDYCGYGAETRGHPSIDGCLSGMHKVAGGPPHWYQALCESSFTNRFLFQFGLLQGILRLLLSGGQIASGATDKHVQRRLYQCAHQWIFAIKRRSPIDRTTPTFEGSEGDGAHVVFHWYARNQFIRERVRDGGYHYSLNSGHAIF